MIEKHIILEDIDLVTFYGVNNANLQIIKALYPKLRIVARGNVIKILGDETEMCSFEDNIEKIRKHCLKYNSLDEETILGIIKGCSNGIEQNDKDTICYSVTGKPIKPRSENQKKLVESFMNNDMIFATGPAGSGKTYVSIALAVKALKNKEIRKIILSRPAVEAGESLGFLPGDLKEKVDPYLRPIYDSLYAILGTNTTDRLMERGVIEVAPLAYMRGRTLDDAFVILDEAQNTTDAQMKMFLTRLGFNSKMVVNGDMTQVDLPGRQHSGLIDARHILKNIDQIKFINFSANDVVRHPVVAKIITAYEKEDIKH